MKDNRSKNERAMERIRTEFKKQNDMAVYDPEREKEKLEEIRRISPNDMEDSCVMLYNKVMELSRELQEKIISE